MSYCPSSETRCSDSDRYCTIRSLMTSYSAYLVHVWVRGRQLRMAGRLSDGRSFAALSSLPERQRFLDGARPITEQSIADPRVADDWQTFGGTPLREASKRSGATLPADPYSSTQTGFGAAEEFLLFAGIRGPVQITGPSIPGKRVDRVFQNPGIAASDHRPDVVWLAFDLETDREQRVTAVSLVSGERRAVLYVRAGLASAPGSGDATPGEVLGSDGAPSPRGVTIPGAEAREYQSEAALLAAFCDLVRAWDPDIITGWNIIDFDFPVLTKRLAAHSLPFDISRADDEPAEVRRPAATGRASDGSTSASAGRRPGSTRVVVPGRQVVDAMRIVRGTGRSFPDLKLETVAQEVLGRGKHIAASGQAKMAELERLQRDDPEAFCAYCLEDSQLVLDILGEMQLDELTLIRACLTGMNFDYAWTSIPAFERIYALELIRRRTLPPRDPIAAGAVTGAAGGTVLDPIPGLFANVLVFDFRSLYPSIMRTFNIDPLVFTRTQQTALRENQRPDHQGDDDTPTVASDFPNSPDSAVVTAPNGASFSREPGILPELLGGYFAARTRAIAENDSSAAFVYKILMNSFYGVLGSGNCLYGHSALAGAITGFGKLCLLFARDWFEARGFRVLYGDTDSVFVYAGGEDRGSTADRLAAELNSELSAKINVEYGVESFIEIRSDTVYRRFLLPRLRGGGRREQPGADSEPVRGRAKGYAGSEAATGALQIKGMEAARSDYTALAKRFQTELLELVFTDAPAESIDAYVRGMLASLTQGDLDGELVYHKMLRRPAEEYEHAASPQVRAARAAGWTRRRGRISYLMTVAGPEPVDAHQSAIDYAHYVEHQLRPIWDSVAEAADFDDSLVSGTLPVGQALSALHPLDDQLELGF
ncbi:MAG: DNA polymerase II [Spirochaetaceae bacterium]|nr:MAG: DNA polymerase II [Spirochaetaceae bacterium]